jgi:anaerobic magnesium-protoporphyrin IX monomethyl ester cyclase
MSFVTIVRPPSVFSKSAITLNATPPLSPAYLAGSVSHAGHEVQIIDAVGEALDQTYECDIYPLVANGLRHEEIVERIDPRTRVLGISCLFTSEWPEIRKLLGAIRRAFPDIAIVGGGEHITAEPDYSLGDCAALDYAALGEGEETIVDLVGAIESQGNIEEVAGIAYRRENGEIAFNPRRQRIAEIDDIPLPRWDLTPIENYLEKGYSFGVNRGRTIPMLATRGCPYQCTFCSSPNMWTTRWKSRRPDLVVDEIESYIQHYNVTNIDFYDLTAVVRKDWIIEFAQHLIDRKLNITWQLPSGTRSEALDEEVLPYLYRSGCRNLSYAPESGSPRVLKKIKKKVEPKRMVESMRTAVANGLNVKANIIFGFPDETHSDVWRSLLFVSRMAANGVNDVSVWTYSPYPGTEMYTDLKEQGKMADFDDSYFSSLLSYADLKNVVSWDDELSARSLKVYRIFGLVLFYAVSYASNPLRFYRTLRNLMTNKHESRMEMTLSIFLKRFGAKKVEEKVPLVGAKPVSQEFGAV